MTEQLQISINGRLGRIVLDRPQAINALSLEMIEAITATLTAWADDDAVAAVLFEGNGPKGFCSGGDVRAVRALVVDGRPDAALGYFAAEYRMNGLIAGYRKPLVALTHGIVMGGGIGIAGHCRYRIAQLGGRFAMPEAAIGFFADVGVNAILAKAPLPRALLFAMSGASVGTADALALGLIDCAIASERVETVRAGIAAAAASSHPETAIVALMEAQSVHAGEAAFSAKADLLPSGRPDSPQQFLDAVAAVPQLAELSALLGTRSPTAVAAIFHAHLAARATMDVHGTLAADLRLGAVMAREPDFAEGVRAVLVDKDNRPKWSPVSLAEVDTTAIEAAVKGP